MLNEKIPTTDLSVEELREVIEEQLGVVKDLRTKSELHLDQLVKMNVDIPGWMKLVSDVRRPPKKIEPEFQLQDKAALEKELRSMDKATLEQKLLKIEDARGFWSERYEVLEQILIACFNLELLQKKDT